MGTKESRESLQSRLSFFHPRKLFSSDRDDSSDSDDYLETGPQYSNNPEDLFQSRYATPGLKPFSYLDMCRRRAAIVIDVNTGIVCNRLR